MSETVETVRVKSKHVESQGPFVRINKADFVEGTHELYAEGAAPEAAKTEATEGADAGGKPWAKK